MASMQRTGSLLGLSRSGSGNGRTLFGTSPSAIRATQPPPSPRATAGGVDQLARSLSQPSEAARELFAYLSGGGESAELAMSPPARAGNPLPRDAAFEVAHSKLAGTSPQQAWLGDFHRPSVAAFGGAAAAAKRDGLKDKPASPRQRVVGFGV